MNSTSTSVSSLLRSRLITRPSLSTFSLPFISAEVSTMLFSIGQYCSARLLIGTSSWFDFSYASPPHAAATMIRLLTTLSIFLHR